MYIHLEPICRLLGGLKFEPLSGLFKTTEGSLWFQIIWARRYDVPFLCLPGQGSQRIQGPSICKVTYFAFDFSFTKTGKSVYSSSNNHESRLKVQGNCKVPPRLVPLSCHSQQGWLPCLWLWENGCPLFLLSNSLILLWKIAVYLHVHGISFVTSMTLPCLLFWLQAEGPLVLSTVDLFYLDDWASSDITGPHTKSKLGNRFPFREIRGMAKYDIPLTSAAAIIRHCIMMAMDSMLFGPLLSVAVVLLVSLHLHMNKLNLQNLGREVTWRSGAGSEYAHRNGLSQMLHFWNREYIHRDVWLLWWLY